MLVVCLTELYCASGLSQRPSTTVRRRWVRAKCRTASQRVTMSSLLWKSVNCNSCRNPAAVGLLAWQRSVLYAAFMSVCCSPCPTPSPCLYSPSLSSLFLFIYLVGPSPWCPLVNLSTCLCVGQCLFCVTLFNCLLLGLLPVDFYVFLFLCICLLLCVCVCVCFVNSKPVNILRCSIAD